MKIRDSLYPYPGFVGTAIAHLRVYEHDAAVVAVVGELTDNPSTSVTNQAEVIAAQLRSEYGPAVIVIEHYPPDRALKAEASWTSLVDGSNPRLPDWRMLSTSDVEMLAGEPVETWAAEDYRSSTLLSSGTAPE